MTWRRAASRRGTTLLELLVVLVILALLGSIVASGREIDGDGPPSVADATSEVRHAAIHLGRPQSVRYDSGSGRVLMITAYPTGLVRTGPAASDRSLTSERTDASH